MKTQIRPVTAAVTEVEEPPADVTNASQLRWESVLMLEGKATDDGRMIEPGAISWRELPLSLMAMTETSAGGHEGAAVAGRIDRVWRVEGIEAGVNEIRGSGVFDDSEFGREVARLVSEQMLRGVSVDLAIREFEYRPKDEADVPGEDEEIDLLDVLFGVDMLFVVTDGSIGAATVCPFPAFADAEIALVSSAPLRWQTKQQSGMTVVEVEAPAETVPVDEPLTVVTAAAAGLVPAVPPAEWFEDPGLEQATAIHVTDEGRIFGHAAAWDVCHIGFSDACVLAPRSQSNYAYFHLGELAVEGENDENDVQVCGQVTLGTGHANLHLNPSRAVEHYDNTGTVAAYVVAGEDEYGIWVAGSLNPSLEEERVRELRAAKLSGDWRSVDGNLELVAILAVNVPGFPVPRVLVSSLEAGADEVDVEALAEALALVSAGVISGPILEAMREREAAAELELQRMAAENDEAEPEVAADPVPFGER